MMIYLIGQGAVPPPAP